MADGDEQQQQDSQQDPDPIIESTLSGWVLVASVLLFASLVWSLYDELIAERPWKAEQEQFVELYSNFLERLEPQQAEAEQALLESPEYIEINQKYNDAQQEAAPRVAEIDEELAQIRRVLAAVQLPYQDMRARIAAMTYRLEHSGDSGRESLRQDIDEVRQGPFRVQMPDENGGQETEEFTADELTARFNDLKAREAALNAERITVTQTSRDLSSQRNTYLGDNLEGLNQQQINGILARMDTFEIGIKQIHVEEAGLVDRCESCHLGIREPVDLTAEDMGGHREFVSHPNRELLSIHDPVTFGCSPCHNGNGLATASVEQAHGNYTHWLWPLFPSENVEAGCVQCHVNDRVLDQAPVLNRGRDLFSDRGCVGCHRHAEYDREIDRLTEVQSEIQNLESQKDDNRIEIDREIRRGDLAETNEEAQQHYATSENLRVSISNMEARIEELDRQSKYLLQDQKKVGPNLKDVRLKLRKEWIPVWLTNPHEFRPGTKMPRFRLTDEEVRALSAFVWQSGLEGPPLESQPRGNAERGQELFETRGCMACHSMGEGENQVGGDFAANLSRLGEKANYDYIVRWVHNPRERTRPYCAYEQRDLGPEDYARHGLPFEFDLEHSTCPNDGHELQVQNMTVMPNLRLSIQDARDIATYLTSLQHEDATYPSDVTFMDDPALAERGRTLTSRYGCGSCHEIQGLENAQRIGTELTFEASKPLEQLDFALLEPQAKREGWYDHKGFFERKLRSPEFFDQGREKAPEDLLRMPNLDLPEEDVQALTTFLLGSMESPMQGEFRTIPESFRYIATDRERDIQEGWWLVKKYNCEGCHRIAVGQEPTLSTLPRYQDPDWVTQLPPSLIQEGARANPDWLAGFLSNPSLSETNTARNGVRSYLEARMPTFNFSPNEISTLIRFFQAMAGQPGPYIPTEMEPLTTQEQNLARELFSSNAAPCLRCHLVGDPARDQFASAPNFLIAKERLKPGWTGRWLIDPQAISPGTPMPSGLFRQDGDRWVFAGPTPASFANYQGDHVDLLVRYLFQLTAAEQQRLLQRLPGGTAD